ncbi:hypothetical protein [Nonomuraea jabiensis]|uniref:hypothetical protein n=1 Tax=Nonomuraea jabiensis TaxID=882448 RepID=UPI0036CCDE5E
MSYTVEWTDHVGAGGEDVVAVVTEALVPIVFWPRVTIVRAIDEELTIVERFLLEAALRLGKVTNELIEEVTDLPSDVLDALFDGLVSFGLLAKEGTGHVPQTEEVEQTLLRGTLRRHSQDTCTIAFLPQTDEAVAYGVPLTGRRRRSAPAPSLSAPVDKAYAPVGSRAMGRRPSEILQNLLARKRIARLPADVIQVMGDPDEPPLPERCPAYRVDGVVRDRDGMPRLDLRIATGDQQTRIDLSGADALAARWTYQARFLEDPEGLEHAAAALGCEARDVTLRSDKAGHWEVWLNERAATAAAAQRSLTLFGGFNVVHIEDVVTINVELRPADNAAAKLFALDQAAARVRGNGTEAVLEILRAAAREFDLPETALSRDALIGRLWTLAQYDLVYSLRESEDFAYG